MPPSNTRSSFREFDCVTDCPTHGQQASILAVFRRRRGDDTSWQDPLDVATLPPVCPECTHIDAEQATVVSLTEREDLGEDREVTPDGR